MDIKDFVALTLKQAASSVQGSGDNDIKFTIDESKGIEFDLAVTADRSHSSAISKDAKASLKVVSGDYSREDSSGELHRSTSRVKLVVLPRKQYEHQPSISIGGETSFRMDQVF